MESFFFFCAVVLRVERDQKELSKEIWKGFDLPYKSLNIHKEN